MKSLSKIIMILLLCVFILSAQAAAEELKVGDVIGYALYSDVIAYIDGSPIQTYNINGHLAVIAGDLKNYGISVWWDEDSRTTYIIGVTSQFEAIDYSPEPVPMEIVGLIAEPIYYTDIKCKIVFDSTFYGNNKKIRSFNVSGYTAVYLADIAAVYADSYVWNAEGRTSHITLVQPWVTVFANENYDFEYKEERPLKLNDGFSITFENVSENGEPDFIISESSGADYYFSSFGLYQDSIKFFITASDIDWNDKLYYDFTTRINISIGGGRMFENTPERRKEAAQVFRVYINDKLVSGELYSTSGNNTSYYTFFFDRHRSLDKIKTVRVELGYK